MSVGNFPTQRVSGVGMTQEELRAILQERGVQVVLDEGGNMRLRGKKAAVTPALQGVLELYRGEFRRELDRVHSRRVVLVRTGEVVAQWSPGADWGRVMELAAKYPGERLSLEHYRVGINGGQDQWVQFATTAGTGN